MKKLKKLRDKVRRWLIRKLGGYTNPVILPEPRIVRAELRPVRLQAEHIMRGLPRAEDAPYVFQVIERQLNEELFNRLIESKAISLARTEEPGCIRFRATLLVCPESQWRDVYVNHL